MHFQTLSDTLKSALKADERIGLGFKPGDIARFGIDSREIVAGDCFIAIQGEKHDANDFVPDCHRRGCRIFVMARARAASAAESLPDSAVFGVDDTVAALSALASAYRKLLYSNILAITGSSGKTTTRELVVRMLETRYRVHTAKKNLNNEIGLPLTLLDAPPESHFLVLEMGMNHSGEISRLTRIARPDLAMITNIGWAHVGNLGGRDGIALAKAEIFEGLSPDSSALLCRDDEYFAFLKEHCPVEALDYGKDDLEVVEDRKENGFRLKWRGFDFDYPAPGDHNLTNLAGAFRLALHYGIEPGLAVKAATGFRAVAGRNEIIRGKFTLINDCYNANPSSMSAGLKMLAKSGGRRIAVLADMRELGSLSGELHAGIGKLIRDDKLADLVLLHGEDSKAIDAALVGSGIPVHHFSEKAALIEYAKKTISPGDTVLVKASRGMRLEEVVDALRPLAE